MAPLEPRSSSSLGWLGWTRAYKCSHNPTRALAWCSGLNWDMVHYLLPNAGVEKTLFLQLFQLQSNISKFLWIGIMWTTAVIFSATEPTITSISIFILRNSDHYFSSPIAIQGFTYQETLSREMRQCWADAFDSISLGTDATCTRNNWKPETSLPRAKGIVLKYSTCASTATLVSVFKPLMLSLCTSKEIVRTQDFFLCSHILCIVQQ